MHNPPTFYPPGALRRQTLLQNPFAPPGGGRVPVGLAVFKTVARPASWSRVGSTPMHLRQSILISKTGHAFGFQRWLSSLSGHPNRAGFRDLLPICCQIVVNTSERAEHAFEPERPEND